MNLIKTHPDIFVRNKYLDWYEKIISGPDTTSKVEKHHIVPKSIVPNNNLVSLSIRQHYIAHLLLVKCVQPVYRKKMLYAITAMKMRTAKGIKFNSRVFEKLKTEANLSRSLSKKGVPRSEETRAKIRAKRALQVITEETRNKMSATKKGKKPTQAAIKKTRIANTGSKRSDETKKRLSECRQYYPRLLCIHCNKTVDTGNYNRWHGDNCRHKISDAAGSFL